MPRERSWTDKQLAVAVATSYSYRAVIIKLHLIPAGGNYVQVTQRVKTLRLDTTHFTGKRWNKGRTYVTRARIPLKRILIEDSGYQSHKLKQRLFAAGLKIPACELCGWSEQSIDGRTPVELDHINGNRRDNRLVNLRILCPNCHSLQITHRGKNKKVALRLQRARVL